MRYPLLLATFLATFAVLPGSAQSSQQGAGAGQAAQQSSPRPDAGAAPKDQGNAKDAAKDKKKPKKVWTDEDVSSIGGTVSVVGDAKSQGNPTPKPNYSSTAAGDNASSYRSRLAPLREQLDALDREIREMKSAKGAPLENVDAQVQIREARKEKILKQITEIEDEARRHGIAPGDLR